MVEHRSRQDLLVRHDHETAVAGVDVRVGEREVVDPPGLVLDVTVSPIRIGCVIAIRIPATMLARVWRAAKPITRPSTALEARIPVASR